MEHKNYSLITNCDNAHTLALCKALISNDLNLVLVSKNQELLNRLETILKADNVKIITAHIDVEKQEEIFSLFTTLKISDIPVSVLVNSICFEITHTREEHDLHKEISMINQNIISALTFTNLFLANNSQDKNRSIIVNIIPKDFQNVGIKNSVCAGIMAFMWSWSEHVKNEISKSNVTLYTIDTEDFKSMDFLKQHKTN